MRTICTLVDIGLFFTSNGGKDCTGNKFFTLCGLLSSFEERLVNNDLKELAIPCFEGVSYKKYKKKFTNKIFNFLLISLFVNQQKNPLHFY